MDGPLFNTVAAIIVILTTIAIAIAGMGISIASGWLTSYLTRRGSRELYIDALLGALGSLGVGWGCVLVKRSDLFLPTIACIVAAIVLPALYRLSRLISLRRK